MKNSLKLLAAGFFLAATVNAQTDNNPAKKNLAYLGHEKPVTKKKNGEEKVNQVSYRVREEFYSDFGNTPVTKWERSDYFDEATFRRDGKLFTAFYDNEAKLVGTTSQKTFTDLPARAQQNFNKKYKNYIVKDVIFFDDNELNETDMTLFDQQFEDADNYFVELEKDNKKIVVQVNMDGDVSYFKKLN